MADQKFDGVIEAVHYSPDGAVDWVRGYLRRGAIWSDRIILRRQDLIDEINGGRKMMLGQRVEFLAGTFEVTKPLLVKDGFLVTSDGSAKQDHLEGAPVL
jgi:hypothetical protein